MKIGILQAGYTPKSLADEFGQYPMMFEQLLAGNNFEFEAFAVIEGDFPENINACDGWLITGSSHSAYDKVVFIAKLEDFIRDAYSAEIPIVGICFGHQIMAQALGGKVEKFVDGLNIGQSEYQFEDQTFDLLAIHQDQVTKVPKDAAIILSSDFCKIAGLAYTAPADFDLAHKQKAISFQPHPEFSSDFMRALIDFKSKKGFSIEQAVQLKSHVKNDNNAETLAMLISNFFNTNGPDDKN